MEERTKTIQNVTAWGAVCNLGLTGFKLVAGILGRSSAMVADAVHSLSDLISDIVVIIFARVAGKGQDKGHDYGHGKFETLATVAVSFMLLVVGAKMGASAVEKINAVFHGEEIQSPGWIALVAALVSIIVKEILFQWSAREGKRLNSQVMIANAWHHRTDAMSSVGSLLGIGGAMLLGGKWTILDPLVGLVISVIIIVVAVKMSIPALSDLTDASLDDESESRICAIISSIEGISDVHALKTRRGGQYTFVEAHIVVDPDITVAEAHNLTEQAEDRLREVFGAEMLISLHIEPSRDAR